VGHAANGVFKVYDEGHRETKGWARKTKGTW
jgi:hypothetical protein